MAKRKSNTKQYSTAQAKKSKGSRGSIKAPAKRGTKNHQKQSAPADENGSSDDEHRSSEEEEPCTTGRAHKKAKHIVEDVSEVESEAEEVNVVRDGVTSSGSEDENDADESNEVSFTIGKSTATLTSLLGSE
jgi:hypothetical protein